MTQHLVENQTRTSDPTPYANKLAGALREVFGSGTHDLAGLVGGLNRMGIHSPDGSAWTEQTFAAEIHRMGA